MALYELSSSQVKNLLSIIAEANIKGSAVYAVVNLIKSLNEPIEPNKKDAK